MNLALVLGQKSESLKPKLISVKDNLNIECFVDLQHFINDSIKRDLMFDRVIVLSVMLRSEDYINDLYNYWNNYNRNSEVVLLCKKTVDDDLAKLFLSRFCSTNVTSMSVTSTTLQILSDAVILPVSKITNEYGMSDYLSVEVENDSYEEEKKEQGVSATVESRADKHEEKRSIISVLFGKKKKNVKSENLQNSDISGSNEEITNSNEDSEEYSESQCSDNTFEDEVEEESNGCDYTDCNDSDLDDESSYNEDSSENYEDDFDFSSSLNNDELNSDFEEDDSDSDNLEYGYYDTEQDYPNDSDVYSDDTEELPIDDSNSIKEQEGCQEEVVSEIDEDFGDLTYSYESTVNSGSSQVDSNVDTEEVRDLDIDLSVGSAEEEYRKKMEQPKVIKETVVKEVIKSVKTSSVLENIYKGTAHKLVIVTGDRGSGVTTTAWSLALHFSKEVPVLYFDCDVLNHGLMNYIDYFEFKNYEQAHIQGVKLCKSSKAFSSCVCKWDTNIDLLTSDFGVEVDDDELMLAQGIVAENLTKYGVVIVDCPFEKLHCIQDLILTGNSVLCVEDNKRGFMNTLSGLDRSPLPLRYKKSIISRGTLVRTKVNSKHDYKRLMKYINSIVDLEDCNWLDMTTTEFSGRITSEFLTEILEG